MWRGIERPVVFEGWKYGVWNVKRKSENICVKKERLKKKGFSFYENDRV